MKSITSTVEHINKLANYIRDRQEREENEAFEKSKNFSYEDEPLLRYRQGQLRKFNVQTEEDLEKYIDNKERAESIKDNERDPYL